MIEMSLGGLMNKFRGMIDYFSTRHYDKARSIYPNQNVTANLSDITSAIPPSASSDAVELQGRIDQVQRLQTGVREQLFIREEVDMVLPTGRNISNLIEALRKQGYGTSSIHVNPEGSTSYSQISVSELANSSIPYNGFIFMFAQNNANIAYLQLSKGSPGWRNVKGAFFDYTIRATGGIGPSSKEITDISDAIKAHTFNYPLELLQVKTNKAT